MTDTTPAVQPPRLTLSCLLQALTNADNGLMQDFDPAELVGDVRTKVDAIKGVLDRMEHQRLWCETQAAPLLKAATSLKRNHERLTAYVLHAMKQENFEELPGHRYRAVVRNNPPAMKTLRSPTNADVEAWPEYCEKVVDYRWLNAAIKEDLLAGVLDFDGESPFAEISVGQKVTFPLNAPMKESK